MNILVSTLTWMLVLLLAILILSMVLMENWAAAAVLLVIIILVFPPTWNLIRKKAMIVGASEGGFIGSNLAVHNPERVEKLILLGPMGYTGAQKTAVRITFTQFFPLAPIQRATFKWAFGENERLVNDFGEWFLLLMSETFPAKVPPLTIKAKERDSIDLPVLFVLGENDRLVGEPVKAAAMVKNMPDSRVITVEAGHLMGAEVANEVNRMILDFAGK